jgi:hypothetical protein
MKSSNEVLPLLPARTIMEQPASLVESPALGGAVEGRLAKKGKTSEYCGVREAGG